MPLAYSRQFSRSDGCGTAALGARRSVRFEPVAPGRKGSSVRCSACAEYGAARELPWAGVAMGWAVPMVRPRRGRPVVERPTCLGAGVLDRPSTGAAIDSRRLLSRSRKRCQCPPGASPRRPRRAHCVGAAFPERPRPKRTPGLLVTARFRPEKSGGASRAAPATQDRQSITCARPRAVSRARRRSPWHQTSDHAPVADK